MNLQMLKKALISYVTNSAKAVWSAITYPLSIQSAKECDVKNYRIYGAEGGVGEYDTTAGKYKIPVVISTANLLDLSEIKNSYTSRYGEYGIKHIRGAETNGGYRFPVNLTAGTTIYLSYKFVDSGGSNTSNRVYLRAYPTDGGGTVGMVSSGDHVKGKDYVKKITLAKDIKQVEFYAQYAWEVGSYFTLDNVKLTTEAPITVDIYLDAPLGAGEIIQQSVDGLPSLPQFKGTTVYEVDTQVKPSGIEVCYYE